MCGQHTALTAVAQLRDVLSLLASHGMQPSQIIFHYLPQMEKRHISMYHISEISVPWLFTAPVSVKGRHGQGGLDTAGLDLCSAAF